VQACLCRGFGPWRGRLALISAPKPAGSRGSHVPGPSLSWKDKPGTPAHPARAGAPRRPPPRPWPARPTWPNFLSLKGQVWERRGGGAGAVETAAPTVSPAPRGPGPSLGTMGGGGWGVGGWGGMG
jgi:hypothetical protein